MADIRKPHLICYQVYNKLNILQNKDCLKHYFQLQNVALGLSI